MNIHSRHLHVPLRGIFGPNSLNVARYAALIWAKSPTKRDAHLTGSNVQARSGARLSLHGREKCIWIFIGIPVNGQSCSQQP
uniref:DUF6783 domain-containing protein n=1 Tax=Enterocloster aldenensis TaxID=358742 RepID=UPI003EB6BF54